MTVAAPPRPLRDPLGDRIHEQVALQAVLEAQAALGLLRRSPPALPLAAVRSEPPPRVVAALGLGADSSAIVTRYIKDQSTRDFDLHELVVITGMTGQVLPPVWTCCC